MAYRREMFERYGLFRTDLGPRGREMIRGEDTEFGLRLLAGGERVLYVPGAIVYHPVEPERMRLRYFEQYYFGEGRMQIRAFPLPAGTVRWLGIPRYCYRGFVEHLFRWATSLNPRARAPPPPPAFQGGWGWENLWGGGGGPVGEPRRSPRLRDVGAGVL